MIEGSRSLTLINFKWYELRIMSFFFNRPMGALQIPIETFHRSESGKEGSIVLNQLTRNELVIPKIEFPSKRLSANKKLIIARN